MNEIDPQILTVLNLLADDQETIAYRKRLNKLTDSVTATILLQQIIYWSKIEKFRPFYKFRGPCSHRWYKEGDSWTEELGFSLAEFDTAIKKIGTKITKGDSKAEAYQGTTPQHMVIYWTDSSRVSWYHLNANLLGKLIISIYLENQDSETTQKSKKTDLPSSEITPKTTTETTPKKDTPADFGIGETDPLEGVPIATDNHQRIIDQANGGEDEISRLARSYYSGYIGGPESLPESKAEHERWKHIGERLAQRFQSKHLEDLEKVCYWVERWWHSDTDKFWKDKPEADTTLHNCAKYVINNMTKHEHPDTVIEKPPLDEAEKLRRWWREQRKKLVQYQGWLENARIVSRENGTLIIAVPDADSRFHLEENQAAIEAKLYEVDHLEVVE